jgi:hypothetical protein
MAGPSHNATVWELRASLKYDALCLLNALADDPFYLSYYRSEFEHFDPLLTEKERGAIREVKRIVKDEAGGIASALLALVLSTADDERLGPMVRSVEDSSAIRAAFEKTAFWDPKAWATYERARPALAAALRGLERVGFERYWESNVRPQIDEQIRTLAPVLPEYNVVPAVERLLGRPLPSNRLTVFLLQYSQPHGIRITGTRFLTHVSYPWAIVLRNALHELMHPPYDASAPEIRAALDRLGQEPTVREQVEHHDRSFGYNSVAGYVEEDCVQALDQIVGEQFGLHRDPRWYWRSQDDGMHVLAAAVYAGYRPVARDDPQPTPFPTWFVHAVADGALEGRRLGATLRRFFDGVP